MERKEVNEIDGLIKRGRWIDRREERQMKERKMRGRKKIVERKRMNRIKEMKIERKERKEIDG